MPITVVQAVAGETPFDGSSPFNHNINITAVGSGNGLVVTAFGSDVLASITDNQSGTYTEDYAPTFTASPFWRRRLGITDGPTQVQLEKSNSGTFPYAVFELSGVDASTPLGQTNTGTSGFSSNPTVSVTTTTNNEMGIALLYTALARVVTPPSGWTLLSAVADQFSILYNADLGAAGSKTCNPTLASGTNSYIAMATYRAAAGSASPLNKIMMYHGG